MAGADRRPATDPVDGVEHRRALGEAGTVGEERLELVDRVVDGPPLAAEVPEDGVVPAAHPAVPVGGEHRCAADAGRGERVALPVQERAERAGGPAGEDAVPRQRAGAAAAGGDEQVVVAAAADHVGGLVAPADGDLARGAGEPHGVLRQGDPLGEDPAAEAAGVEHPGAADALAQHVGVDRRAERAARAEPLGPDHDAAHPPRPGGGGAGRDADRGVLGAAGLAADPVDRVGDRVGQVVALEGAGVDHVGRPQLGGGAGPARLAGQRGADVLPVHQVAAAHHRQPAEGRRPGAGGVPVAQRVGGAVHVPVAGRTSRARAAPWGPSSSRRGRRWRWSA